MKTASCIILVLLVPRFIFAMASTDFIEGPIKPDTAALYGFPDNTLALINDWHRVYGWHPWFSELPNATYYFAFSAPTLYEVNELLGYFGEIKSEHLLIELNPAASDWSVGQHFEKKDKDRPEVGPLTFRISSQKELDRWFDRLDEAGRKKFHVTERPNAGAPAMTLYAGHKVIDLEKLKIPSNATVHADISDLQRKDPTLAKAIERIERFVNDYNAKHPTKAPASGVE